MSIFLFLSVYSTFAQEEKYKIKTVTDTVFIDKNTLLYVGDSLMFVENDTVIYLQDTIKSRLQELLMDEESDIEKHFFEELAKRKDSSGITKRIIEVLTDFEGAKEAKQPAKPDKEIARNAEATKNKIVGNIWIEQLPVFGPNVNDTAVDVTSGVAKLANRLHMRTRESILLNRLLIKTGDKINPEILLDNERLIRSLPYVRDARLIAKPAKGDTVDLLLISQDLLAYTGSAEPYGFDGGKVRLNNINMLGYGHQLFNTVMLRTDRQRKLGYIGRYSIPNIRGSQASALFTYRNTDYLQMYQAGVERNFLTPNIEIAGGVNFEYKRLFQIAPDINDYQELSFYEYNEIPRHLYKRFSQDYWIARSYAPNFIESYDERARLVVAMRYFSKQFSERPSVAADKHQAFHNRDLLLFSIGISRQNYTTERLVYGYGITEDIPLGGLTQLTFGPEKGEFNNRFYSGLNITRGKYIRPLGYISAGLKVNGYWEEQDYTDGQIEISTSNFSYPIQWRNITFRTFLKANYSSRFNVLTEEDFSENMLSLNDDDGIRGLRDIMLFGREKLSVSFETMAYLPFKLFSFRFATFAFADAGMITNQAGTLFKQPIYQGYGLGFRIRNDRLAFKTFQLRVSCYPNAPPGESFFGFSIASIPVAQLMDFNIRKPAIHLN